MNAVFESCGLRTSGCGWPDLRLTVPGIFGWAAPGPTDEIFDVISGLKAPTAGTFSWFGETGVPYARTAFVEPGGGLLANLPLYENIFLPALDRGLAGEELLWRRIDGFLEGVGFPFEVPPGYFSKLPHEAGPLERVVAGLLRAALLAPGAVGVGNIFALCSPSERALVGDLLLWLHRALPEAVILLIVEKSTLPAELSADSLELKNSFPPA